MGTKNTSPTALTPEELFVIEAQLSRMVNGRTVTAANVRGGVRIETQTNDDRDELAGLYNNVAAKGHKWFGIIPGRG